jgi:hypothetical protein
VSRRCLRVEGRVRAQRALDVAQDAMHLLAQFERCRAWLHAAADLDQQRIIELLAQARQRVTDSRLGAADPFRGSGYVALRHQLQPEIEYIGR